MGHLRRVKKSLAPGQYSNDENQSRPGQPRRLEIKTLVTPKKKKEKKQNEL